MHNASCDLCDAVGEQHHACPPNTALELTPQAASKIVRILKADFGTTAISIYRCGATQRQAVRQSHNRQGYAP
jgi:hypothetical protein